MEDLISQLLLHARGIWTYRWPGAALAWLLALGGWSAVYVMPDQYQSSARVYVDTQTILKPLLAGMTSVPNVDQQVSIMSRTLLSRPNIARVMRMVDLDVHQAGPREQDAQAERMRQAIRISGTPAQDIYTMSYQDRNPKLARDVVQALLTIFVEGSFTGKQNDTRRAVQFIDTQLRSYEERLVAAENAVTLFKQRNSPTLPHAGADYHAQLGQTADALAAAHLAQREAQQTRQAIIDQIEASRAGAPLPPRHPELDERIAQAGAQLDALRLQFTEVHPDVLQARRLLAQLAQRRLDPVAPGEQRLADADPLQQQLRVALAEVNGKLAAAGVRVGEHSARQARLVKQQMRVPEIESQLAQLNRAVGINQEHYEKLLSRREAARLSGELAASADMMSFRIIDPPTLPSAAVTPSRPWLSTGVLLGALAGGAAAAFLISQARPTFSGPGQMRELLGLHVLGSVSMHRQGPALRRQRKAAWRFGSCLAALLAAYGGALAASGARL